MPKPPADPALTLEDASELVDDWLVHLRGARKSDGTLVTYERGVRQFLAFCAAHGHVDPINRRSVDAWLAHLRDEQKMQGYTARSRLTAVRQFAKWLLAEHEIEINPLVDMTQPAVDEKLIEPFTSEQIHALLKTCQSPKGATPERVYVDTRDAAIIRVLAETGMRAGELVELVIDDVHWKDADPYLLIRRTKTRRGRSVPLSANTAEALSRYMRARRKLKHHDSERFWLAARGGPLQYAGLYDALVKHAKEAGITDMHPHRFRHTAAHRWLSKGGSEGGLMSVAGWQSPQMVMRYTRAQASARAAEESKRLNLGEL
ncbi:tyrosine recombinase XerC [Flexivirga endophytica]|uniref:Tyrosine recombinase XerC n=1 Tax=Flexivirga endophytica TaxID=1849103 RepID=A0A916SVC8_9MICO|nr:tyrosine-type recombinase/integrase [Flexivirga endophytica]GGB19446.1 tyrosine recombinase XerC [Flexivirga endophytica]GHB36269.1 tyrosine recombinase XerC [Flexivirga endophytica]